MKTRFLINNSACVFLALVVLNGCAGQREPVVEQNLRQQIAAQSGGALALSSFSKTNGFDQNVGGLQLYTLEWQAHIAVQADVWKGGNAIVGYWNDFGVMPAQPTGLNRLIIGGDAKELIKGATIVLTGNSQLQKTDNGWRVMSSEIKTSQTLNNVRSPAALAELQRQQEAARLAQQKAEAAEAERRAREEKAAAALAAERARQREAQSLLDRPRVEKGIVGQWAIGTTQLTITKDDTGFAAEAVFGDSNIREISHGQFLPDNRLELKTVKTEVIRERFAAQMSSPRTMWIELGADEASLKVSWSNNSSDNRWKRIPPRR